MSTSSPINPVDKDKPAVQHVDRVGNEEDEEAALGPAYKKNRQFDEAAKILAENPEFVASAADEKRVLRMIDWRVCFVMCILYMTQQIDKGSLSSSAVFGIQTEANLQGSEYAWLGSCVYAAELVAQPLSAFALIYFPLKYWIVFNYLGWSCITMITGATSNFAGLLVCRILLGCFEATILPSFVFLTQMWYTRREATSRTAAYQISNSFASIIAPLLTYGIGHAANGKVKAYQAIFLFIGGFSLAWFPLVYWLLPNSPTTAKFLEKGDDRLIALTRLKANNTGTKAQKWKWSQVAETFRDPKTWLFGLMYLLTATPSGGFGTFGGLVTKGFGFDSFTTILMQMPIGVIQILGILGSTWLINHYRVRWIVIAALCIPPIGAAAGLVKAPRDEPGVLLVCYYISLTLGVIQPNLYSWCNQQAAGSTKRVVTSAFSFSCLCIGNIIGPQFFFADEAPYYFTGIYVDIGCWAALFVLIVGTGQYLKLLNRRQVERRRSLGMPADIKDMSIMPTEEAKAYKLELTKMMLEHGMDEAKLNDSSFDDLTDFENPFFMYVV